MNTLAESYGMDPISLTIEFENWMDMSTDENFNASIEALEYLYQLSFVLDDYHLMHELYSILVVLLYSTEECERGFSL